MAQYNTYVRVPHETYQQFRNATLGNGYNVDGWYGNQCWDFCALLWWQYGRDLRTKLGGGAAYDCWLVSRAYNAQPPFSAITGKENVKRGDVLVWNRSRIHSAGHIAIADEDYNPSKNTINCLGQNQGQGTAAPSNIAKQPWTGFLGIFRNKYWASSPSPEPEPEEDTSKNKKDFPWPVAWNNWPNFNQ